MSAARRAVVRGRVQGVGFRWSARAEAERIDVSGWVRNLPDGSVEALVQGAPDAVAAMLAWLRRGPSHARVDACTDDEAAPERGLSGFEIRG